MTRWLDGHVAAWVVLAVLNLAVVGVGVLIQRVVRKRKAVLTDDARNDAVRFAYGFIGLFYTFFIGVIVSAMWSEMASAYDAARDEGSTAVQLAMDLRAFNKPDSDRIRQSLLAYERSAIDEWNVSNGARSAGTDAALARLYDSYNSVQATTDAQKATLTMSLSSLDALSHARTDRLLTAEQDQGLGWALWFVIILISVLALGAAIVYGVEDPALHYPMVAVVGLIVAANLFIIMELSYPYVGAISADSEPMQAAVRVLTG